MQSSIHPPTYPSTNTHTHTHMGSQTIDLLHLRMPHLPYSRPLRPTFLDLPCTCVLLALDLLSPPPPPVHVLTTKQNPALPSSNQPPRPSPSPPTHPLHTCFTRLLRRRRRDFMRLFNATVICKKLSFPVSKDNNTEYYPTLSNTG